MKKRWLIFFFTFYWISSIGQTCCSGGIPIASNVGFSSQSIGTLLSSLHFEHNYLNDLLSEDNVLAENNRKRITNSFLWRLGYTFHEKWSVESLVPYIIQKREILRNNGTFDKERSEGLGDIVILVKYELIQNPRWNVNVGLGPKFATANSEKTNSSGLLLIKDLQPGTGSLDLFARMAITFSPDFRPSTTVFFSAIHSWKGADKSYLGSQSYKFGNDLQIISGISDQIFLKNMPVYPSVGLRIRYAALDQIDAISLPNTGGKWLFLRTNLGIEMTKNLRLLSTFEWPIYAKVDGTQLSPTSIFNIGILFNLSTYSQQEILLP